MKRNLIAIASASSLVGAWLSACAGPGPAGGDDGGDDRILQFPGSSVEVALRDGGGYTITYEGGRQIQRDAPSYVLELRRGAFDPRAQVAPPVVPGLDDRAAAPAQLAIAAPRLYLVQFVTQPIEEYRQRLAALGATTHQYLPGHAHIVRMTPAVADAVRGEPSVRWVGEYRPSWRVEPALAGAFAAGARVPPQRYWIHALTTDPADKAALERRLAAAGAQVHDAGSRGSLVGATLTSDQLAAVAGWSDVIHVDRWSPPETDMDIAREIDGANYVESIAGYRGQGVRAEVMDGNVLDTHSDFQSRPLVLHGGRSGDASHGTPTTGIVFGDGTGNIKGRGMLPAGQGIFASYLAVTDRYAHTQELLAPPYEAVFQSNSWGDARTTAYTNISAAMDQMLFDLDILVLQSQSNAGNQQSRPQAWAKNLVSVGGIKHLDTLATSDDRWDFGASIGPAADGRIKPDLAHFYDLTFTPGSSGGYTSFGGTSGATPITAGHAGLFFQMWSDGRFGPTRPGTTVFAKRPRWTTAKAMLINGASPYPFTGATADLTRTHQGWGRPNVRRLYDLRDSFYIIDESDVLPPGGATAHRVQVAAGTPELRATLTWADPPAVPSATRARVNDLTLRVTSPSGTVYFGNTGLRDGNQSLPGGSADTIDTVENVWIVSPEVGVWTVEVRADEINTDGHVETAAIDADYALVVSAVEPAGPAPQPHVRFAQVAYDTPGNDNVEEWIELFNPGTAPVALGGWQIRDNGAAPYTIPAGTSIGAGAYLIFARDAAGFRALTGKTPNVAGLTTALGNGGDRLTLVAASGATVDFVAWEGGFAGWSSVVATVGRVILRVNNVDTDGPADWAAAVSQPRGGL